MLLNDQVENKQDKILTPLEKEICAYLAPSMILTHVLNGNLPGKEVLIKIKKIKDDQKVM